LLFGFGAILSSLMSVFALRQFLKSGK
jgi:hypothetical protein